MTSCGPYSQRYNFTHMFDTNIMNGKIQPKTYTEGSIMYLINTHHDFNYFSYIIKLAEMDLILDNIQANFTLFVPSDTEIKIKYKYDDFLVNMDQSTAKSIVLSSLLDYRIPSEILQNSPASYFNTKYPPNRLFVTNINANTKINNFMNVIHFDIICNNGIVHVVDKLINPLEM